jgi:integrase/recombinase XerD
MSSSGKKRISTNKKQPSKEEKLQRIETRFTEWPDDWVCIQNCYLQFKIAQMEKGNSKQTVAFYDRFYKKLCGYLECAFDRTAKEMPIDFMTLPASQLGFQKYLGDVSQQTVNAYLRGWRAFGNYCEELGYLDGFKCSIKEVPPPVKEVYTEKELSKLLVKPEIGNFEEFRNYTIINLLLATGARTNTILNIRIRDVDLEEGYIVFNTTKANKVVRLGLERKCKSVLQEYILYWRNINEGDTEPEDYLFCNTYGEQLTRSGLTTAIVRYNNRRGVEKTSLHLFRHTFAKNWITSGGDLISLAQVLTHSELEMVKRYANLYGNDVKKEIEEHSTLSQLRTRSGKTLTTKRREQE